MLVLGFADYRQQAQALAHALQLPYGEVEVHRFPDGESRVRVPLPVPERVIVCRSLDHPDSKLVELLLCCATLREKGAQHITLVAPYLCYMRQDLEFHPGEAVSQRIIGRWLAGLCERVVTVDPHLHRISYLEQAIPSECVTLTATEALGAYIQRQCPQAVLLGPDSESAQWVAAIAELGQMPYGVAEKIRQGDRAVEVALPAELELAGRDVVLVDDMISTGRTLIQAARAVYQQGARAVFAVATHALCTADDLAQLQAAGIRQVLSTDSVTHSSNAIALAELFASGIRKAGS